MPDDDAEQIWLSPTRTISPELREHLSRQMLGMSVTLPPRSGTISERGVTNLDAALSNAKPAVNPHDLATLGRMRLEVLEALGLMRPDRLESRALELSKVDLAELRHGVVDLAKLTIDRLLY